MKGVLLFDLYWGGHHGLYLDALRRYWAAHALPGPLHVAVGHAFARYHEAATQAARDTPGVQVHLLDDVPENLGLARSDAFHGHALREMVARTGAAHAAALYWDHLQLSTALRRVGRARLSGIYFRPSFHYGSLGGPAPTPAEKRLALRKKLVLRAALANPRLDTLFCLDPFVVPIVNRMAGRDVAVFLPDPVPVPPAGTGATIFDGAETGRRRVLLFGMLDSRKGVPQVCEALAALAPDMQQKLAVAFAGPADAPDAPLIRQAIGALRDRSPVQVLWDDRFVPDAEIQQLIEGADLVLLTYQQHIGSSNVLVRAAGAGVPVLASHHGLVGAQVRGRGLGLAIDATRPDAIAEGLARWLDNPAAIPFDGAAARRFFDENTAEAYARCFWNRLYSPLSLL